MPLPHALLDASETVCCVDPEIAGLQGLPLDGAVLTTAIGSQSRPCIRGVLHENGQLVLSFGSADAKGKKRVGGTGHIESPLKLGAERAAADVVVVNPSQPLPLRHD